MIRTRNVNGSSADSPSPHITITDTAQPRSRQGSNASTLSNTSSEFRHRTSTNPFEQAPAPTNPSIDKTPVVVEDLSVGDLRKLLQQHKIDYRTANGRVELEMLATGLYWIPTGVVANQRSGSDRSSSVSQRSSSNPNSIEVPAPLVRSNSTGRIDRETKPAAGNPPKSSSALSLFAQYKQKSGGRSKPKTASNPTQPRNPTTTSDATPITSSNSTSSCPSQSAGDMFKTRNNPRVSQQSVSSVSSVSSSTSSTVTFGDDVEPIKSKRLSAMATDFFGSLRADSTESVTSVNSVFETSKPTTQQQQQEQPSINEQDENNNNHDEDNNNNHDEDGNASLDDVSEDDLSDDDTSDDDDDDDDEDDGVAQKGGKKASDTFWAKMQDSSTTAEADSTGGDVAAELRKAKRREKLAAMVKKF